MDPLTKTTYTETLKVKGKETYPNTNTVKKKLTDKKTHTHIPQKQKRHDMHITYQVLQ